MKRKLIVFCALVIVICSSIFLYVFFPWLFKPGKVVVQGHGEKYDEGIYLYDLRWGAYTRITSNKISAFHPVWAPNGDQIAFIYEEGGQESGIQIIKKLEEPYAAEKMVATIPSDDVVIDFGISKLAWSPDGTQIMFNAFSQQREEAFYIVDLATKSIRKLNLPLNLINRFSLCFAWAPSENPVIEVDRKIYLADLSANQIKFLVDGIYPFWRPSSQELTYFCIQNGLTLCGISKDGKQEVIYSGNAFRYIDLDKGVSWSSDGKFIGYFEYFGEGKPTYMTLFNITTNISHQIYRTNWLDKVILDEVQISPK